MAMILLDPSNRILAETFESKLPSADPEVKREACDVRLCDFDEASYRVYVEKAATNVINVQMSLPCYAQIKDFSAEKALNDTFGALVAPAADGYDVCLRIDGDNLTMKREDLVRQVGLLKNTIVGSVWKKFFVASSKGEKIGEPFKFKLRPDTTIYFFSGEDRVTMVYELDFPERVDKAVARVFLQEFVECKRHVPNAPSCLFAENPPLEMKAFGVTEPSTGLGFVTFALQKNHLSTPEKIDKAAQNLQLFRSYMQYHIKCSKTLFHSRMRARVRDLLKVLNRAKAETDDKEKKTISGKTFTRQPSSSTST